MKRPTLLAIVAALALSQMVWTLPAAAHESAPAPAAQKADGRIPVKTKDDLPRHTYRVEGKASEFLLSDAPFKAFVQQVKQNAESDLAKYKIEDRTTLQEYYALLQTVALFEHRDDDALKYLEKAQEIEAKESKKLMMGMVSKAMIEATKATSRDAAAAGSEEFVAAFKKALDSAVRGLPWDKVREEVMQGRGRAQIISRALVLGQVQGGLDPVVEQNNGEIGGELAKPLVNMRVALDRTIPLQKHVGEVYTSIIDEKESKVAAKDLWTPNLVELAANEKASPVVVAIWDSGVDTSLFADQLYVNPSERMDGKDNDNNGFVDDVHGIAFDLEANKIPELVHPLDKLNAKPAEVMKFTKGFSDNNSNIDSKEAGELRVHMGGMSKDQVTPFIEDLGLFGNHSHGTHVAGIAAAGNPFVRLMPVRITFDYKMIPTLTPTVEQAKKDAQSAIDAVKYMVDANVRVVNMSWGGSREGIEGALEMKGVGKTPEERAAMSRKLFSIGKNALEEAMNGAPDILFIAAAGNSDNDNTFSEMIPSGLDVGNMITVGAIDGAGKPTNFTSFGKNVELYANGFEIESYVPGGVRMKYSGTSMAAPQVANLAAKILAINPSLSGKQVVEYMKKGADPLANHPDRFIINPKKTIALVRNQ